MRTTDFSRAPAIGQATAQFVGGTRFTGVRSLVELYRRWRPMVRRLKESPGYRGHHVWYGFPFTLGTIAFFSDQEALLAFARSPEHAELMRWVMEPGKARGGFIRFYEVKPHGYSSGVWRAEAPHEMKAIDRFTALGDEEQGPLVRDALRRSLNHW
jgi:heme-degrading monooxygenase HmoA